MDQFPPGYLEESRAAQILAGNATCQILGTLIVFARVCSRFFITRTWKAEDSILVAAWFFATGYSVGAYGQVAHGAGRHIAAFKNPEDAVIAQKYAFANNLILFFALALPKISICFAYLRIFYYDNNGRRLIQVLTVILVLLIVPFFIETLLSCTPIHVYWTELRPADKCLEDISTLYVSGTMNIVVDLALMALLIPRILHMKINRRQKNMLLGIVLLGSLAVAAAIVRMVRVGTTLARYLEGATPDPPWDTYDITIWTSTEIYVSLICAAAPGIKPLISLLIPHLLGSGQRIRGQAVVGHGYADGSLELGKRKKRTTFGTGDTLRSSFTATGYTNRSGTWREVGRGADQHSIGSMSNEEGCYEQLKTDGGIVKKSEIMIYTTEALKIPDSAYLHRESA